MSTILDTTSFLDPSEAMDFIGTILEASTEYSMIGKDLDGTILLWNSGARNLYGYEPEEVVGRVKSDILHTPEDIEAGVPQEMREIALREGKWEGTVGRVRRDGSRFTARVVITPRLNATGEAVGFLLISKDISEDIRLTEALEATQFYTRSLIESNIDALMTTDPLGVITDVNEQMEWLTGHTRDELIGSPFANYFADSERATEGVNETFEQGVVTDYVLTLARRDGAELQVSFNASVFRSEDGKVQGIFASARDITDQAGLQSQLAAEQ